MSSEIVAGDGRDSIVRAFLKKQAHSARTTLPVIRNEHTGLAPTYFPMRVDGGAGASTLALMLSYFSDRQPLIIQVGGLKSWAYRDLAEERFIHVKGGDEEDPLAAALDHRLSGENIGRPAIVEFEQAMPVEAIKAAEWLAEKLHGFVMFCPIASRNDIEFKLLDRARDTGLEHILPLRQYGLGREEGREILRIPQVPSFIMAWLQQKAPHIGYVLDNCERPVHAAMFADKLESFKLEIVRRMNEDDS